jgi:hypothetical protein
MKWDARPPEEDYSDSHNEVEPSGQGCTMTFPQATSLREVVILAGIHRCFTHGGQFLELIRRAAALHLSR